MDEDTAKILQEGQKVADFVKSDAWFMIKAKLEAKIAILDSLSNFPRGEKNAEVEIEKRVGAIAIVREWIDEIEGDAEQHNSNAPVLLKENDKEEIIKYN